MKARVILKLRDGSDFSYDDCYEYDDLEKAANDIADEILKKRIRDVMGSLWSKYHSRTRHKVNSNR